jgi:hypothetical protein
MAIIREGDEIMGGKTRMTSRIAIAPETLDRVKEFARGLAAKNNDELINFLLDSIEAEAPDDVRAGLALREAFNAWKAKQQSK